MRIAVIVFNDFVHDGRQQRICRSLQKEHEVRLFGFADNSDDTPDEIEGVPTTMVWLATRHWSRHPGVQVVKYAEYFIRTALAVRRWKPDALMVVDTPALPFAMFFNMLGVPIVYNANEYSAGTHYLTAYNAILFKALLALESAVMRRAYRSFAVNDSIAEQMARDYNIRKPLLIRNIPDMEHEGGEIPEENLLHKAAGLSDDTRLVIHVGGLTPERGLHTLVKSVKLWDDNIALVFLGGGHIKDELEALRDELDLQQRVVFLDPVPQNEVLAYVAGADAGVVAFEKTCMNHWWGLPNKFFQQGLAGVPLLTSAFPEMKPIVDDYHMGATFDPASAESMADAVNKLIRSNFKIADEDLARFRADFNWRKEEQTLLGVFRKLQEGVYPE